MEKQPFIARSSLVPVLACIAALLFSANFFLFLQRTFKKWWGWDFRCRTEYVTHRDRPHLLHRHDHKHRHDRKKRHTIVFDFNQEHDADRARQDLDRVERTLRRNLDRAVRDLERLNDRRAWDATVAADLARLEEEVRAKAENLERVQRALERYRVTLHRESETDDAQRLRLDGEEVEIIIKNR